MNPILSTPSDTSVSSLRASSNDPAGPGDTQLHHVTDDALEEPAENSRLHADLFHLLLHEYVHNPTDLGALSCVSKPLHAMAKPILARREQKQHEALQAFAALNTLEKKPGNSHDQDETQVNVLLDTLARTAPWLKSFCASWLETDRSGSHEEINQRDKHRLWSVGRLLEHGHNLQHLAFVGCLAIPFSIEGLDRASLPRLRTIDIRGYWGRGFNDRGSFLEQFLRLQITSLREFRWESSDNQPKCGTAFWQFFGKQKQLQCLDMNITTEANDLRTFVQSHPSLTSLRSPRMVVHDPTAKKWLHPEEVKAFVLWAHLQRVEGPQELSIDVAYFDSDWHSATRYIQMANSMIFGPELV